MTYLEYILDNKSVSDYIGFILDKLNENVDVCSHGIPMYFWKKIDKQYKNKEVIVVDGDAFIVIKETIISKYTSEIKAVRIMMNMNIDNNFSYIIEKNTIFDIDEDDNFIDYEIIKIINNAKIEVINE